MKKFTHCICYVALGSAYLAALLGIDKNGVTAATALLYFILAVDEVTGSGGKH